MPEYLVYFNQQWVGDHSEEWFRGRVEPSVAVMKELKDAGAYIFAGGLEEEDGPVYSAEPDGGTPVVTDGPYVETKEFLGGFTVIDVPDDETAKMWAGRIAEGCGWPQEVRRFKPRPPIG
ncbi:YciI family protein [Terrabacter terrae]|uniref:YciI family protein n=1 Tax=Terrabacter terrae TaxID=318434 RepID=A0ABP5FKV1_9MICO